MSDELESTVFYWLHTTRFERDGTIVVRCSIYDDEGHSSAILEISPEDKEHPFWKWLSEHPDYQRSLNDDELNAARDCFALESGLS